MPPRRVPRRRGGERIPRAEREEIPPPPPHRRVEELFLRQNPPSFNGTEGPAGAELWVRAMERIFNFLHCTDQERLSCVAFQMVGSADFWWEARKKVMSPDQLENFTWENFKMDLYDKYIPKSYRKKQETEFFNLKQGKMSVTEYDRVFCDMSRFAPQQVDTDEKMSEKFRYGLNHEIRVSLAGHGVMTYTEALSRALDIEAALPEEKVTPTQNDKGKRKWEGNQDKDNYTSQDDKRPWQGNQGPQGQGHGRLTAPEQGGNTEGKPKGPPCLRCHNPHHGACLAGSNSCFRCGQQGHFAKDCPGKRHGATGGQNQPRQAQPPRALHALQQPPYQQQQWQGQQQPHQARAYAPDQDHPAWNEENGMGTFFEYL